MNEEFEETKQDQLGNRNGGQQISGTGVKKNSYQPPKLTKKQQEATQQMTKKAKEFMKTVTLPDNLQEDFFTNY